VRPLDVCTAEIQQKSEEVRQSVKKDADEKAALLTRQMEINAKT
jgi:hypothetical protein